MLPKEKIVFKQDYNNKSLKYKTQCPTCNNVNGDPQTIERANNFTDECYFAFGYVNFWAHDLLSPKQLIAFAMKISGCSLQDISDYLGYKYKSSAQGLVDRALDRLKLAADFVQIDSDGKINYLNNKKLKNAIETLKNLEQ